MIPFWICVLIEYSVLLNVIRSLQALVSSTAASCRLAQGPCRVHFDLKFERKLCGIFGISVNECRRLQFYMHVQKRSPDMKEY